MKPHILFRKHEPFNFLICGRKQSQNNIEVSSNSHPHKLPPGELLVLPWPYDPCLQLFRVVLLCASPLSVRWSRALHALWWRWRHFRPRAQIGAMPESTKVQISHNKLRSFVFSWCFLSSILIHFLIHNRDTKCVGAAYLKLLLFVKSISNTRLIKVLVP